MQIWQVFNHQHYLNKYSFNSSSSSLLLPSFRFSNFDDLTRSLQFFLSLIIYANFSTFSGTLCVAGAYFKWNLFVYLYDLPKRALFFMVSISFWLKSQRNFHSMIWKAMIFCLDSFVIEATFAYFEKLEKRPVCTKCTHPSKFWSTKRRKQGLPNYWCPSRVCKSFVANGHQIISINRSKRQILIHYY